MRKTPDNTPVIVARRRYAPLLVALAAVCGCDPPALTPNGVVHSFGSQGLGPGQFGYPRGIARSPDGKVFIADKTARIQRFDQHGSFEIGWSMPQREAGKPVGLGVHADGRVFVADTHYHRVIVFTPDGEELSRFGELGTGDGQFQLPTDVAFDDRGFVYVSEYNGNDRVTRWSEVPGSTGVEYAFESVFVAGPVAGRVLRRPSALAVDGEQTLWIADACNHRLLRFDLDGKLLAEFGEMGKAAGQLRYPYDIDVDDDGNLLVCEFGNCRLQWFDPAGRSLRVWGKPGRELGELSSPWGAVVGKDGLVFVLDSLNARVQVIRL